MQVGDLVRYVGFPNYGFGIVLEVCETTVRVRWLVADKAGNDLYCQKAMMEVICK